MVSSAHRQISKVEDMYWVVVFRGKMERWVLVPVLGTALSLFDTFIDDLGEKKHPLNLQLVPRGEDLQVLWRQHGNPE